MIKTEQLQNLLERVKDKYGYDFTQYSETSLKRRIENFMDIKKIISFDLLFGSILQNEAFFEEFVQEVTVNVTDMFRDPGFYKSLRENVFPRLTTYPYIRVWIAGCSTGEEVYSLAIMLHEFDLLGKSVIYATDINQKALKKAKEGIFRMEYIKNYIRNYQKAGCTQDFSDYYLAKFNGALINKFLKKNIVFSIHNLVNDQVFNEFHLILCRNVLIYFNQELQNKVINLFYSSLCPFGYLGLGNKESLLFTDKIKHFKNIDKKERIFMRHG